MVGVEVGTGAVGEGEGDSVGVGVGVTPADEVRGSVDAMTKSDQCW